jgi:hypothetical protein
VTDPTPIPAEAVDAAAREIATWYGGVMFQVIQPDQARFLARLAVIAAAPILRAEGAVAGRTRSGCCQAAVDSDGHTHAETCVYLLGLREGRAEGRTADDEIREQAYLSVLDGSAIVVRAEVERQVRTAAPPEPCPLEHVCDDGSSCGCWCDLHDVRMDECPTFRLVTAWLSDAEKQGRTAAAADIRAEFEHVPFGEDTELNQGAATAMVEYCAQLAEGVREPVEPDRPRAAAGRTAATDARWDDGHRAGWIEGRADGLDAGRSEAAAAIRAKAARYSGEQFRHFEMCARIADGERVPPTRQDAAAARVAENGAER